MALSNWLQSLTRTATITTTTAMIIRMITIMATPTRFTPMPTTRWGL